MTSMQMNIDDLPDHVTPSYLAEHTPRCARWWRNECAKKKLTHLRLGREYLIPREALIDYLKGKVCLAKITAPGSNGEQSGTFTKLSGLNPDDVSGSQLARGASALLREHLKST